MIEDGVRAAIKAAIETKGDYSVKRGAAYTAARAIFDARIEEWPKLAEIRAEATRLQTGFIDLVRQLCAVGRVES